MGEPYIDTLEDADGTKMYPITKAEAVYLPDNARLDEVVVRKSNRPLDPSVPLIPIDAGTLDGHGVEYFATAEEESSSQGRNLIPYPYYRPDSYVHNGITFTVNDDGSVTANGTATANAYILLCGRGLSKGLKLKKDKTYTLGAAPEGASSDTYYIYINCNTSQGGATNVYYIAYDEPVTFKPVNAYEPETIGLTIYIKKDVVADNLTFYPMLEEGSVAHKYEPTKESNVSLKTSVDAKFEKPSSGIPKTDLASAVQTSLGLADTALQSYTETDPTVQDWAKTGSGISVAKSVPSDAKFTDTVYSLPTATSSVLGGVKTGSNITNTSGVLSLTKANVTSALGYTPPTTNTTYGVATTSANGLMSASDKVKMNAIGTVSYGNGTYKTAAWAAGTNTAIWKAPAAGIYLVWMLFWGIDDTAAQTVRKMYMQHHMDGTANRLLGKGLTYYGDGPSANGQAPIQIEISQPVQATAANQTIIPYIHTSIAGITFKVNITAIRIA